MDPVTTGNRYWDYGRMLSNAIYQNDYSVIAQKWNSKDLNGKIEFVSERAVELGITFGLLGKTILHGSMGGIYRGGAYVAVRVGSAFARSEAKNIVEGAFAKESSTPMVKGISDAVKVRKGSVEVAQKSSRSRFRPHSNAGGAHSVFRRDPINNRVTHYETYVPQTNPRNPKMWESVKRFDNSGKNVDGHFNKVLKKPIQEPHVHDPLFPGGVRIAEHWEIPR